MLNSLKSIKHSCYLAWKNKYKVTDSALGFIGDHCAYTYNDNSYRNAIGPIVVPDVSTFNVNHLHLSERQEMASTGVDVPYKIFVCWTGDNEMGDSRRESLQKIIEDNPEFEVILVTADNYRDFEVPEHPIHPAYKKLSYIHRSDYLRAYLMYHYGGVYTDIKMLSKPWAGVVSALNQTYLWAAGPGEISSRNVSPASGKLGLQQRIHWRSILWQSAFAFKPGTPLAKEWLEEVERRLDYFSRLLFAHESQDPVWGLDEGYPVPWNAIMGQIFSPLCLKYHDKILVDNDIKFVVNSAGYR